MHLLNVSAARSTWLFDLNDLNPRGKAIFPELFDFLKENYHFTEFPKSITDLDETKALSFKGGFYQVQEEININVELKVYNDGLAGNSYSSTMETDKFLDDVLSYSSREFHLAYNPAMIRRKIPLSELVFRLDGSLQAISPKFNDFAAKLTGHFKGLPVPAFQVGGISFWTDQTQCAFPVPPAPFTIERKIGAPFGENRFYSKASLHTDKHLELLKDFEDMLKATSTVH